MFEGFSHIRVPVSDGVEINIRIGGEVPPLLPTSFTQNIRRL
jgi:hypothetical protein